MAVVLKSSRPRVRSRTLTASSRTAVAAWKSSRSFKTARPCLRPPVSNCSGGFRSRSRSCSWKSEVALSAASPACGALPSGLAPRGRAPLTSCASFSTPPISPASIFISPTMSWRNRRASSARAVSTSLPLSCGKTPNSCAQSFANTVWMSPAFKTCRVWSADISWLSLGRAPAGRYDLVTRTPSTDTMIPQVNTLVVTSPCARRAARIEFLVALSAELPEFVRMNPPSSTSAATALPLAAEARQFFLTGQPELADRYFPWLVNIMSPAYWVYLVMAVTILFNGLKGLSNFRLWRIDAAREKLERSQPAGGRPREPRAGMGLETHAVLAEQSASLRMQDLLSRLGKLRDRCQRQAKSFATPMGHEMYYRYQQSMIDHTIVVLKRLRRSSLGAA